MFGPVDFDFNILNSDSETMDLVKRSELKTVETMTDEVHTYAYFIRLVTPSTMLTFTLLTYRRMSYIKLYLNRKKQQSVGRRRKKGLPSKKKILPSRQVQEEKSPLPIHRLYPSSSCISLPFSGLPPCVNS